MNSSCSVTITHKKSRNCKILWRFLAFADRKVRNNFLGSRENPFAHSAMVPNGKNEIFPNTMASKPENLRNLQNFLKRKFYDHRIFHSVFKTSPHAITGIRRGFSGFLME